MAYTDQAGLIEWCGVNGSIELAQLTDPAGVTINSAAVLAALEQADNVINSRLAGVTLPLTAPYPPLVVDTANKLARFFLYKVGRPQYVADDYADAMRFLEDVRTGKASIGLDAAGSTEVEVAAGAVVVAPDTVFTAYILAKL